MRTILALILFWIGDLIAKLFLRFDFLAWYLYKPYRNIMILSGDIDNKQKIWKTINNYDEIQ
jgi:hypothetical protein